MEEDGSVAMALASGEGGVLLYYKYLKLGEDGRETIKNWYEDACRSKGLRGRVRVALDGVNCTLGGDLGSLRRHVAEVRSHERIQGSDIDFKLSVSKGPRNLQAAMESGFTTLSVKGVKEVVSMGSRGARLSPQDCGRHVSPREFHDMLRNEVGRLAKLKSFPEGCPYGSSSSPRGEGDASVFGEAREGLGSPGFAQTGASKEGDGVEVSDRETSVDDVEAVESPKNIVLLDVRNVYETNIGHFSADGIDRLDPETRQFSDLPAWVDANVHRMRGKRVLMYCTGGVRCEKASALVSQACEAGSSSSGTEVLQLAGGIERYLQAYPGADRARGDGSNGNMEIEGGRRGELSHVEEGVVEANERRRVVSTRGTEDIAEADESVIGRRDDESFFRGKNFVFDERISVPELPTGGEVIGRCLLCRRPWDDYSNRARCCKCRMLVLVCDSCMNRRPPPALHGMSPEELETNRRTNVNGTHREAQAALTSKKEEAVGVLPSEGDVGLGLLGSSLSRGRHGTEGIPSRSSKLSPLPMVTDRSPEETAADTKVASPPLLASQEAVASTLEVPGTRRASPKSISALLRQSLVSEGMSPGSSQVSASPVTCARRGLGTAGVPEGQIVLISRHTGSAIIQNIVCGFCRQRRKK